MTPFLRPNCPGGAGRSHQQPTHTVLQHRPGQNRKSQMNTASIKRRNPRRLTINLSAQNAEAIEKLATRHGVDRGAVLDAIFGVDAHGNPGLREEVAPIRARFTTNPEAR